MMPASAPLIALSGVTRSYGMGAAEVRALDGVDLTINEAEFVAIMGPSGSGKSTAMNLLGCLDVQTQGSYRFMGVDVRSLSRDQRALLRRTYIGFVFQGFNLLPRTSAVENVELPLIYMGMPARRTSRHGAGRAGQGWPAEPREARPVGTVRRPATAGRHRPCHRRAPRGDHGGRADGQPRYPQAADEIMELLTRFNVDEGITIVMVTHEPDMAEYAQRVIHFRDGRIEHDLNNHKVA